MTELLFMAVFFAGVFMGVAAILVAAVATGSLWFR